jgi:hypothetical protein
MTNVVKMLEMVTGDERVYGTTGSREGIPLLGVSEHSAAVIHPCVAVYVLKTFHSVRCNDVACFKIRGIPAI